MRCTGCGFNMSVDNVPADNRCNACGGNYCFDSDDFLLRQHNAPGRDVRPGQVQMGRLVEKVIRENAIAFIEAPVGSGKSDAYGVPSINAVSKFASFNRNGLARLPKVLAEKQTIRPRILISTAKKALQHQIAEKDLPFIRKRHGEEEIGIALLKGKGNYACRLKIDGLEPDNYKVAVAWLDKTPSQDLSDFPGKRPPFLYDVTAEDCVGKGCKYAYNDKKTGIACGYWRAKQEAAKSSIIITNHHVVAYDLRFGPGVLVGAYTTLVLDEAHQAPASFRAAFSQTLSQGGSARLLRQIDNAGINGNFPKSLNDAWKGMFGNLQQLDGEVQRDPFGKAGGDCLSLLDELNKAATSEAQDLGFSSDKDFDIHDIADEADRSRLLSVLSLRKTVERTVQALATSQDPGDNTVLYVQQTERGQKKLVMAPISVGKLVGPKLQMLPSIVITSATMAIGGKFEDMKYQLGLNWPSYSDEDGAPQAPKQIHELILTSPFDYKKQAILYTPRHIPLPVPAENPERSKYISAVVNECARLIEASNGNAFVLFTSRQDLDDVNDGLLNEGLAQPLIVQGDDASAAFKQYMATPNSVLLGMKSFWEGVDVQGQKLQLVIITKLPFPAVTDPVIQARARQLVAEQVSRGVAPATANGAVFSQLQIPHMLTELRQGAGRLIRSKTDKGVLAILDPRMFTGNSKDKPLPTQSSYRGYGKLAADSTGFTNQVFDFEIVQRVFAKWNNP